MVPSSTALTSTCALASSTGSTYRAANWFAARGRADIRGHGVASGGCWRFSSQCPVRRGTRCVAFGRNGCYVLAHERGHIDVSGGATCALVLSDDGGGESRSLTRHAQSIHRRE